MLSAVSLTVVFVFGFVLFMVAAWGVAAPQTVYASATGVVQRRWGLAAAVAIRLLLGVSLVLAASASRFPLLFQLLGWLSIAAAVLLVVLGRERIDQLMALGDRSVGFQQAGFLMGGVLGMLLVIGTLEG